MIIRGAKITEEKLLAPTGELLNLEESTDDIDLLFHEECKNFLEKGRVQGEKEGYGKALSELTSQIGTLQRISMRLLDERKSLVQKMKPEVVEFALKVCERILRSELADPQRFMEWIEALLSDAIAGLERAAIKVYLAPSDLTNLENHITHIEGISFHSDPLMLPGDCRIAGKSGLLNASIARQLEDVKAKVCGSEKKSKK